MKKPIELRVVLFPETVASKTLWVAQCLNYDLVAQGVSSVNALESFRRLVMSHVALSIEIGTEPFTSIATE